MAQTTVGGNIYFPRGAKVQVKESGAGSYTDVGAVTGAINISINYDESETTTNNYGTLAKQIRNMSIDGGFNLINLNPAYIAKMSGGLMEVVTTAGSAVTTCPDQTISSGWADDTLYELDIQTSSSDSTALKASAKPTLTSVTLDPTGTPEVLAEDTDYVLVEYAEAVSGWAIQFISGNMSTSSPTTYDIEIDYDSVTPVARETVYMGSESVVSSSYAMKFTSTDSASKVREIEVFACDLNSGLALNFKGADEEAPDEVPISFKGRVDVDRTDGRQLISWVTDSGWA